MIATEIASTQTALLVIGLSAVTEAEALLEW
jgi:hypothetical protein